MPGKPLPAQAVAYDLGLAGQILADFGEGQGQQTGPGGAAGERLPSPGSEVVRGAARHENGYANAAVDEALEEEAGFFEMLDLLEEERYGTLHQLVQIRQEQRDGQIPSGKDAAGSPSSGHSQA